MRLITYNLLDGGRDATGSGRLDRITELLHDAQPDLLVLQECKGFDEDGGRPLYRLETALGMRGALAPAPTAATT